MLSIVFSFRNESEVLNELIDRVDASLKIKQIAYEMIFVNDDSTDDSVEIILGKMNQGLNITLVNMSRRFGVYPCLEAGLRQSSGDVIVYLDSDLQDPPELLPEMMAKIQEGFDVVYTTRKKRLGEPAFKLALTKLAYKIINRMAEIDLPVDSGDYKMFTRKVLEQVLRVDESEFYFRGILSFVGFRQYQLFYERHQRFAGTSHFPIFLSSGPIKTFMSAIVSFSSLPLLLPIPIGILFILILGLLAFFGSNYLVHLNTLISITNLLFLGIIGMYLSRLQKDNRKRPKFIIKEVIVRDPKRP